MPGTSPRREILEIHKSLGMTVLFLSLFRQFYRLRVGTPATLPGAAWQTRTAAATQAFLYALMLAIHPLGTAWHVLVLRDGLLRRMAPNAVRFPS